jgi:hypothetical protein
MKKILLAGVATLALMGSTAVYAQQGHWRHHHHHHMRFSAEDRAAFADARIAAIKAGLKLTPDQEKLWPPVESAMRDFAKLRIERANARMQMRDEAGNKAGADDKAESSKPARDPMARLRERADNMTANGAALKKIADAADPLYKTLDQAQKRRLMVLIRMEGFGNRGWHHRHHRFGGEFDRQRHHDGDGDHGGDQDSGPGKL